MGFEISRTDQVRINEVAARAAFDRACNYASKIMADINPDYAGYDDMWALHFYEYQRGETDGIDTQLELTIDYYDKKLGAVHERAGVPWELDYDDEQECSEEQELKTVRKRGRMLLKAFEWLSPTSRGKKSDSGD